METSFLHMVSNLVQVMRMIKELWPIFRRFSIMPFIKVILKNCLIRGSGNIIHQICWVGCRGNIPALGFWTGHTTLSENVVFKFWKTPVFRSCPLFYSYLYYGAGLEQVWNFLFFLVSRIKKNTQCCLWGRQEPQPTLYPPRSVELSKYPFFGSEIKYPLQP